MEFSGIHPTAIIHPRAQIAAAVDIGPYAIIGEHVALHEGVKIGSHAVIQGYTEIGAGTQIFPHVSLGSRPQDLKYKPCESYVKIGKQCIIREYVTMNPGTHEGEVTQIGDHCLLMSYAHVAHNCVVGNSVIMANAATLAGHVVVGDFTVIGGLAAVHQFVRIGSHVMVGGMSVVLQDVFPYGLIAGNPPHMTGINSVGLRRRGFTPEQRSLIKQAYRLVFRNHLPLEQALQAINDLLPRDPVLQIMKDFLAVRSKRGLSR